jgi:putative nucleotidyltransferase with HDIG domain
MTDSKLITRVEKYARTNCELAEDMGLWGLWIHTKMVRKYALELARIEGVDSQVLEIAALLHDIGKCKGRENHQIKSYEMSKSFLDSIDLPENTKELVLECVLKHGTSSASKHNRLEVQVIQAADALAVFFDDEWQEYSRKNIPREELLKLIDRSMTKIHLESARKIAEPQIARLKGLLS